MESAIHPAPSPMTRPVKLKKGLPKPKQTVEIIVLYNDRGVQQFKVFRDQELDLNPEIPQREKKEKKYEAEDYDSSDEIIDLGIKKCKRLLKLNAQHLEASPAKESSSNSETESEATNCAESESSSGTVNTDGLS